MEIEKFVIIAVISIKSSAKHINEKTNVK